MSGAEIYRSEDEPPPVENQDYGASWDSACQHLL